TYVRREQTETAFDLQMVCLAGRRAVLDGLSTALAAGHESAASLATDALQRLPDVADCEDTERLLLGLPPPARPEVRQRLAELEASLHRSIALGDLGAVVDAETLAVEVLDTARVIGYAPFIGRALTQVGAAQAANGKEDLGVETQLAGLEELMAAGADLDVAKAASRLVYTVSQRTHRYEAADIFYRISRAAQRRAGAGEGMRASLLINYGQSLASRGRAEEGLEMVKEGVEICGRIYGLDSLTYARARLSTGPALYDLGRYDELAQTHDEVVAIYHALYGADHPQTLRLLRRTAVVEFVRGEFKVARAQFQRAIVAAERDLGPEHISVVDLRGNLGLVYTALGEFDAAAGELDVVLTRYSQEYGETVGVGEYLINRAAVETARGRMSVAATFLERARTIYAAAPDLGGHLGTVLIELGEVALASGDPILAVQQATRGYKLMLEDYGVDHPRTRAGFIKLLDILIRAGRADLARVQLDGSAALVAEAKRPDLRASLDFVRARLTFAEQPSVAREMAADARNTLALDKYRFVYLRMRQDIDNWLASHE
ncbi:MAG: tetratricopeptide repeat protein, partial [Nannocystaceae bacterium]|nr:tetratricopeptide repeat protein [Nannocystaceae bacterium]